MSYTVTEILEDIIQRVGKKAALETLGPRYILRSMNRIYKQYNNKYRTIQRQKTLDFSKAGSGVLYLDLPTDMIEIFRISPIRHYRQPTEFDWSEPTTFTIMDHKIYISDIFTLEDSDGTEISNFANFFWFGESSYFGYTPKLNKDAIFEIGFYSLGKTLVETVSDADTEVDEPEWREGLKEILLYATALNLSKSYEMADEDRFELKRLKSDMSRSDIKQTATPNIIGPHTVRQRRDDPYSYEAQINPEFR